jgi:hypothetical protein
MPGSRWLPELLTYNMQDFYQSKKSTRLRINSMKILNLFSRRLLENR